MSERVNWDVYFKELLELRNRKQTNFSGRFLIMLLPVARTCPENDLFV